MYRDLLKGIHAKAKDFESSLVRIKTLNDGLINRSEKLMHEIGLMVDKIHKKEEPPKCSICYTRPRAMCFVSCGHVTCEECAERARTGRMRCFTCRTPITDIIRVYC